MLFRRYWPYLLVFLLPYERIPAFDLTVSGATVTVRLSYIVAGLALLAFGWGVLRALSWRNMREPHLWLAIYLAVAAASVAQALNPKRALVALVATTLVVATGVLVSRFVGQIKLPLLLKVLTATTIVVCLVGVFQFFGDSFGLGHEITGLKPIYTKSVFGFPRIQSTGLEPLYFANFLLIPILITYALLFARRLAGWRWFGLLALYTCILSLTLSRGAMWGCLAGVGGISLLLVRQTSWKRAGLLVGLLAIGVLAAVGSIFAVTQEKGQGGTQAVATYTKQSTTLQASSGSADSDRVTNRKLAMAAFRERPWLGFGLGNFGAYAKNARPDLYGKTNGEVTVNNEYYEVLAETGILGLLALVAAFVTLLWRVWQTFGRRSADERVWMVALVAVLGSFAVQYYAFSTLYVMHVWVVVGLLLGLTYLPERKRDSKV
jgi:O-antigen ligase